MQGKKGLISNNNITQNRIGIEIEAVSSDLSIDVEISKNNILGNVDYNAKMVGSGKIDLNLKGNYWGTLNTLEIDTKIYDYFDDISKGKVIYSPVADSTQNSSFYAKFIAHGKTHALEGFPVYFYDKSVGNIKSWQWEFGDGNGSSERNPAHTYIKKGEYNVLLYIYDTWNFKSGYNLNINVGQSQSSINVIMNLILND